MERVGPDSNQWKPPYLDRANLAAYPEIFATALSKSLVRLKDTNVKPLWQIHHAAADMLVSILQRVRPLISQVGLCNVNSLAILKQCIASMPANFIVSVQNNFSLFLSVKVRMEEESILDFCEQNGIVYLAYGCFGGIDSRKKRIAHPAYGLVDDLPLLGPLATRYHTSPNVLYLAYLRHRWPQACMPLVGARCTAHITDLGAVYRVHLTIEDFTAIKNAVAHFRN